MYIDLDFAQLQNWGACYMKWLGCADAGNLPSITIQQISIKNFAFQFMEDYLLSRVFYIKRWKFVNTMHLLCWKS